MRHYDRLNQLKLYSMKNSKHNSLTRGVASQGKDAWFDYDAVCTLFCCLAR